MLVRIDTKYMTFLHAHFLNEMKLYRPLSRAFQVILIFFVVVAAKKDSKEKAARKKDKLSTETFSKLTMFFTHARL